MKELPFMNLSTVYVEITQGWLKALRDNDGVDISLERMANGELTEACKQNLVLSLQRFLGRKNWQPRSRAVCAISANGISLRRLGLPASAREELPKLLRLQIESEFPVSPDDLAWGYRTLGKIAGNGAPAKQELLVAAVKKDRVEEYAAMLSAAGLSPAFTPAAIARGYLCPQPLDSCALLDAGQKQSELAVFENGVPATLRVLPWGVDGEASTESRIDSVAKAIGQRPAGYKMYLTGHSGLPDDLADKLRSQLGVQCERLEIQPGAGRSAAVWGLKKASSENLAPPLLFHAAAKPTGRAAAFKFSQPVPKKWAIRAAVLLCALLVLPYAEALLLKGHLAKKVSAVKAQQGTLSAIDHDFDFLRFLKQNEPPYLDALYLFAKSAPPGTRIESTSMNRRGEVSLRGSMHDGQQVTDFRSKLMDSGFFERVTVEEQVPTPDHQKVNVRITAQWKPYDKRAGLAIGPTHDEIEKVKTNTVARAGSPMPGFPAGVMPR